MGILYMSLFYGLYFRQQRFGHWAKEPQMKLISFVSPFLPSEVDGVLFAFLMRW